MIRYLLAALLIAGPACAQNAIQQNGAVTQYDLPRFVGDHIEESAGGLAGNRGVGVNPFSITDSNGLGVCSNSNITTSGYHRACLGHDSSGNAILQIDSQNGAANTNFIIYVNGVPLDLSGNAGAPHVATTALLAASLTTTFPRGVWRDDSFVGGNAGPTFYLPSTSACSLSGGNGDNGSQVKSADSKCWIAKFNQGGATAVSFGAVGDNVTDDTVAVQAAIAWADTSGIPLLVDGVHKFKISAPLVSTGPIRIEGTGGSLGINGLNNDYHCKGGFFFSTNIDGFKIQGSTFSIRNICIQMDVNPGVRNAGTAIITGALAGGSQTGGNISYVTIYNPYNGIALNGSATQINGGEITLEGNAVREPVNFGYVQGQYTTNDGTYGIRMWHNWVGCLVTGNTGIGYTIFDGDVDYDGTTYGPSACKIGTQIIPGNNQNVNGDFKGTMGDSSGTGWVSGSTPHDLLIQPSAAGGIIGFLHFVGAWASGGVTPNGDVPVLISNPYGASAALSDIEFNGFTARAAAVSVIFDIEAGFNITLNGSNLCSWHHGVTAVGLKININQTAQGRYTITNNRIGVCLGGGNTLTTGIQILNPFVSDMNLNIQGNDLTLAGTPISYLPNNPSADHVVIKDNMGVDEIPVAVASASAISIPNAAYDVHITGTTTINRITNSAWFGRLMLFEFDNGATLNAGAGGGGQFCGSTSRTVPAGGSAFIHWNNSGACWQII